MLKQFFGFILLSLFSFYCVADPLWHCTATNSTGAVWNHYGKTRNDTHSTVERQCAHYNQHKTCEIVCFPPKTYWRCVSHDTLPPLKDLPKNTTPPKQGFWFWTSFSRQVAINGAKDACRHNSAFGGCYVDIDACASTD